MAAKTRFPQQKSETPPQGKSQDLQNGKKQGLTSAAGSKTRTVLLLEYDKTQMQEFGGESFLLLESNAPPAPRLLWEPAGYSFHQAALKLYIARTTGKHHPDDNEEGDGSSDGDGGDTPAKKGGDGALDPGAWESSRRAKKTPGKKGEEGKEEIQQDHYALLGLAHLRYLATDDQIRKAYRDAALKFHPDKQAAMLLEETTEEAKEKKKEEIETKFKGIQMAYEVLMDPAKRRVFDSTDEFDDDIPGDCAAESFFQVYGPVFQRNAKWSLVNPKEGVPLLGDDTTSMVAVDLFYDFWWGFKSWREFPQEDEFDLESAEGREHKRWMERQNSKMREKAKKEENVRIRQLVESAWKRDPRIARRKEEEKKEKQRKKEERNREKTKKEEEERAAAEEAKRKKEEEDKRAAEEAAAKKKEKEKEKKLVRKERARLRTVTATCTISAVAAVTAVPYSLPGQKLKVVSEEDVEELCQSLDLDKLKALCDKLEVVQEGAKKVPVLRRWLRALKQNKWEGLEPGVPEEEGDVDGDDHSGEVNGMATANGTGSPPPSKTIPSSSSTSSSSTPSSGSKGGKGKSASKEAEAAETKPWSRQEVELLRKAINKFPKGTKQRWEVIAGYLKTGRTSDEIVKAVKTVLLQKPDDSSAFDTFLQKRKNPNKDIESPLSARDDLGPSASADSSVSQASAGTAAAAETAAAKSENAVSEGTQPSGEKGQMAVANGGGAAEAAAAAKTDGEAWSDVQEVALVKAIKAFPKETDKRWEWIAAAVPGKNKAQCFKKFQELRENFRSKKAGAAGAGADE